jgi:hypothetical protein
MSTPRRSARIASREYNRAYALDALNALVDALQTNLDLLEQAGAVKDGWITFMMNKMICNEDDIDGSIIGLLILTRNNLPPFSKEDRRTLISLMTAAERCRRLARTIRGGDHRPLNYMENIVCAMYGTVKRLINKID